ncbi:hypothetical protein L6R53_20405 [Myxococcota bacterium]|nr:hypothetical protein [Myxococcota bacterium]
MAFDALSHPLRISAMHDAGRRAAAGDAQAEALLATLHGSAEPWDRALGLVGQAGAGRHEALRAATFDPSRQVRLRAWSLLLRVGAPEVVAAALREHADERQSPRRAGELLARRPHPAVEALVVELATPERPAWLDRLPLCGAEVVRPRLALLREHGGPQAWARLVSRHPRLAVQALAPEGALDMRQQWRIRAHLPGLVRVDPDAALDLVELLFRHEGQAQEIRAALVRLAVLRPAHTFDLVRARQERGLPGPLSGLFSLVRFPRAERLGLDRLRWALSHAPACLPDGSAGRDWLRRLSPSDQEALVAHWVAHGVGSFGAFLFAHVPEGPARDRAFARWRRAAEDSHGVIAAGRLHDLPRALREAEARRHLHEVAWLQSRPEERRAYAALLPWGEAEEVLLAWLRHPEAEHRAAALGLLLSTVRHDRAAVADALAAARRRKNEQDPVRLAMLTALADLPPGRSAAPQVPELVGVVGEALDAADLSGGTARAAQLLAARVLALDPEAGMALLARVLQVRGGVDGHAIGGRLDLPAARRLDPVLAGLVEAWVRRERAHAVLGLALGLGDRLRHMPQTLAAFDGLCALPSLPVLAQVLELLARFHRPAFQARALALFAQDPSVACLPRVARLLALRHTELLDPLLEGRPMTGRFATGRTHWVLDFGLRLGGWTPAQQRAYAARLVELLDDPERDVPTARWAVERLAALPCAPAELLPRFAADPRPPVRELALRALPSADGPEGLSTLLDCMADDRARIAIYALRRCLQELPRDEAVARLSTVPMDRVTVAKEVLRLLGELGGPGVRDHLVRLGSPPGPGGKPLHRDVRIALLRALWDHIEHPPAWALLEAAARDPDPILASRLLSIPMGRLSSEADARLAALFAEVLQRKEPEARLSFLAAIPRAPLRDAARVLWGALLRHLDHPDPAEAVATLDALLVRMVDAEVPRLTARLAGLLPRRQVIQALLAHLAAVLHPWAPDHHRQVARALLPALVADRLAASLAVPLLARAWDDQGYALGLESLSARDHLHHDAVALAVQHAGGFAAQDRLAQRLSTHADPRLRRVALAALVAAARPENGWSPARRALLATLQSDPSLAACSP